MISPLSQKKEWYAIPVCHADSVLDATFYHFFFAVLMPLLELARNRTFESTQRVHLLSCGRFNPILKELVAKRLINIHLVPDFAVLQRIEATADLDYFILDSMEAYFYRHNRFCVRPAALQRSRFLEISKFTKRYFLEPVSAPDVLIINRKNGHVGHGADSRSIPNSGDISRALQKEGFSTEIRTLEGDTLADQVSLFHSAKIVIAQHGSSLANLVWMRAEKGSVIELVPPSFRRDGWHYFKLLAETMGIPRIEIPQRSEFEPVDVAGMLRSVLKLQKSVKL